MLNLETFSSLSANNNSRPVTTATFWDDTEMDASRNSPIGPRHNRSRFVIKGNRGKECFENLGRNVFPTLQVRLS